ncbi:MAG: hypothetical protein LLF86_02605 [Nitrospiraceae bacterium]|nr:hypothetical protein [Nitrospiraceae bacterium]
MTARTKDGKEFFRASKIYMPQSTESRGEAKMVYAPFRKVGIFRDTSLQPNQTKIETFEIFHPFADVQNGGKKVRELLSKESTIEIELWYLPGGVKGQVGKDQFLFNRFVQTINFK